MRRRDGAASAELAKSAKIAMPAPPFSAAGSVSSSFGATALPSRGCVTPGGRPLVGTGIGAMWIPETRPALYSVGVAAEPPENGVTA